MHDNLASNKVATGTMPKGIPYIIGNEAAERFSYYGMRTILVVFMTKYLMDSQGGLATMTEAEAKTWFHTFMTANYFFPVLGAVIADLLWGKYKTIINLSIVYCLGHLALALFETRFGLTLGLTLIAVGAGGIKPCVSAHVGDQFTPANSHLLSRTFSWFYFAINFGAFISTLLTPFLLDRVGPGVAFGVPGALMLLATIVFWMGRNVFIAIPPTKWETYKKDLLSPAGKKALLSLPIVYAFVAMFWALYDQTGSSWVLQADKLDRQVNLGFMQFELLPAQVQAINPVLIMLFTPIFYIWVYPFLERFMVLTALKKVCIGFFLAAVSFALVAYTESRLQLGDSMSMLWQFGAFVIITAAEVMVSITTLEFSYTQAPNAMKSLIMGLYFLSVSLGNAFTALVNSLIQNPDGTTKLEGAAYYWFFAGLMLITTLLFIVVVKKYKEESYLQRA